MRNLSGIMMLCFICTGLIWSCRKEDQNNGIAPGDASVAKYLFDAIRDEVDQQLNLQGSLNGIREDIHNSSRGACANVNISPLGNIFPKTVTITFPAGCKTFAGADIEGSVTINLSGRVRESGSMATFNLSEFKYKNYTLSGNYLITFTGPNSHITNITEGKVVTSENKIITYTATNISTQTAGLSTTFKTNPSTFLQDDVYEISSTSTGINSKGNEYSLSTSAPLIYKVACQWISSGIVTITEDARPAIIATLDYGDGTCDNKATLSVNNFTSTIMLP